MGNTCPYAGVDGSDPSVFNDADYVEYYGENYYLEDLSGGGANCPAEKPECEDGASCYQSSVGDTLYYRDATDSNMWNVATEEDLTAYTDADDQNLDSMQALCDAEPTCTVIIIATYKGEYFGQEFDDSQYLWGTTPITEDWFTSSSYWDEDIPSGVEVGVTIYKNLNAASAMIAGACAMIATVAAAI